MGEARGFLAATALVGLEAGVAASGSIAEGGEADLIFWMRWVIALAVQSWGVLVGYKGRGGEDGCGMRELEGWWAWERLWKGGVRDRR